MSRIKNFFGNPDEFKNRLERMSTEDLLLFERKMEERWGYLRCCPEFYYVFEDHDESRESDALCMKYLYEEVEKREKIEPPA